MCNEVQLIMSVPHAMVGSFGSLSSTCWSPLSGTPYGGTGEGDPKLLSTYPLCCLDTFWVGAMPNHITHSPEQHMSCSQGMHPSKTCPQGEHQHLNSSPLFMVHGDKQAVFEIDSYGQGRTMPQRCHVHPGGHKGSLSS